MQSLVSSTTITTSLINPSMEVNTCFLMLFDVNSLEMFSFSDLYVQKSDALHHPIT